MRQNSIFKALVMGLVGLLATSAPAHRLAGGQTELRMGGSVTDAMAGNNVIIGSAGGNVTVILVVTDTDAAGLGPVRSYQMSLVCDATPLGGATGVVTHDSDGPTACAGQQPFPSPCVDCSNPDYIFFPVQCETSAGTAACPSSLPRAGAAALHVSDAQPCGPGQACYLAEFSYAISLDATGDHGVTIQNPDQGAGGDSFIRAEPLANILFAYDDPGAIIRIPTGECSDPCDDGDMCTAYDACIDGVCIGIPITCRWGDITTTAAGDCVPQCSDSGTKEVNLDDMLCALNGFVDAANCPCADIKGPPGPDACMPDGVIDFDDVLTIIDAFTGIYDCPWPCP